MSETPTPELEQLAAQLFAAARAERPGPALGRRLALIDPRYMQPSPPAGGDLAARAPPPPLAPAVPVPARLRVARVLALAALLAGGAALWLSQPEATSSISISADRRPSRARTPSMTPAPAMAAPVVSEPVPSAMPAPEERGAVPAATPPRSHATQSSAPTLRGRASAAAKGGRANPSRAQSPRDVSIPALPKATPDLHPASSPEQSSPEASRSEATSTRAATTEAPATAGATPLTLLAELELLKSARAALRAGHARQALVLLDRHARERKGSELVAEATLLRIETSSALGDRSEASELAARFVRDNPHSALSDRAKSFVITSPFP